MEKDKKKIEKDGKMKKAEKNNKKKSHTNNTFTLLRQRQQKKNIVYRKKQYTYMQIHTQTCWHLNKFLAKQGNR